MSRPPQETILEIGGEGGSLTIIGRRDPECGWRFINERNEAAMCGMFPEDEPGLEFYERSGYVATLAEALDSLDCYPWHRLYPLQVHPEFRQRIFDAVVLRYGPKDEDPWDRLANWREVCGVSDS